ncbi:MAG: histidine phosphatase family protein [Huintestinicola sp.]
MNIYLIRHGKTAGNLEKRYIGRTDEPLCSQGITELEKLHFETTPDAVVSSPMKRCLMTAELLFPNVRVMICPELCECDFGDFEGKNYPELNGDTDYQAWIDSGGAMPFPNGESPEAFKARSIKGFLSSLKKIGEKSTAAFVVHGGTIMSVMERFSASGGGYYDFMVPNGGGYYCSWDGGKINIISELR